MKQSFSPKMKYLCFFLLPLLTATMVSTFESQFEQKLDHMNSSDTRRWNQTFYGKRFGNSGNRSSYVFLLISGLDSHTKLPISGLHVSLANYYDGTLFVLEHRFTGNSKTLPDLSTENLRYMTTRQAVEDLAAFILSMSQQDQYRDAIWFTIGGSYTGVLAAYLNYKYPNMVSGSLASSAPIFPQVNFQGYFKTVENALVSESGVECRDTINSALLQLKRMSFNPEYREILKEKFNMCSTLSTNVLDNEAKNFLNVVFLSTIGNVVQHIGRTGIERLCQHMTNSSGNDTPVDKLASIVTGRECHEYQYSNFIRAFSDVSYYDEGNEFISGYRKQTAKKLQPLVLYLRVRPLVT